MRFASWNVNGLRACIKKGFWDRFEELNADVFCLQETKLQEGQLTLDLPGEWQQYWNYAERKGYSGTAVFTRVPPLSVHVGIGIPEHDTEGRVLTLIFSDFCLVCVYTPNSQDLLRRLDYRMRWEDDFRTYLRNLSMQAADGRRRPVIVCGDLNVAATEIDIARPAENVGNPGFTPQEREKFAVLLSEGFTDSFRYLHPQERKYSWWSYRARARERNIGWRLDYFLVSDFAADRIRGAEIFTDIAGSDHCPVLLEMDFDTREPRL